jgi:uncharacterized protein (TIGR03546 family)
MITRKIGKLIRGKTTPFQVLSAAILGAMLGFMPGWVQAPGLILFLVLLLIILNANLFVAGFVGVLTKLVSLAAMPVQFEAGRLLLDGPTQPVFKAAINAPVLAYFGFEYYATTGGVLLGLVMGIVLGLALVTALNSVRRKLAGLEEGSERFQRIASKKWVKVLTFVFVGGKKKLSYADLASRKVGNPIRILGVVFAVLVVALLFVGRAMLAEPILTMGLKSGLEQANGATVDLRSAKLDLGAGRLTVADLAMADPEALETDLLRAREVTADVNTRDLLRKRIVVDQVTVVDALNGAKREKPGVLIGPRPKPDPAPAPREGEKTIEDYIKEAKEWKERLAQARKWIEEISGPRKDGETAPTKPGEEPRKETLRERLAREVRQKGYTRVTASHLVDETPTVLIKKATALGVKTTQLEGEVLDVEAENISTQPWLVEGKPGISVKTRSDRLDLALRVGGKPPATGAQPDSVKFKYLGLPTDTVGQQLAALDGGAKPISGGTMDILLEGTLGGAGVGYLDLPLNVTLHDTTVSLPGAGSAPVKGMTVPLGIRGPMDNPMILLDGSKLGDALAAAGANELAARAKGEAAKVADKAKAEVEKAIGDKVGEEAKGVLDSLLGGKKKP